MKNSRQQRTPEEIIAETEARLERLRLKQAQATAKDHPAVSPLLDELAELRKEIREASKGLGSGPQSFEARVQKHENWIAKIAAQHQEAERSLASAEQRKAEIETQIAQAVADIVGESEENQLSA